MTTRPTNTCPFCACALYADRRERNECTQMPDCRSERVFSCGTVLDDDGHVIDHCRSCREIVFGSAGASHAAASHAAAAFAGAGLSHLLHTWLG